MLTLTIIIPMFNESENFPVTITELNNFDPPKGVCVSEVIFVNDGSIDDTLDLLESCELKFTKKIVSYDKNRGRGYAVRTGMVNLISDFVLYLDADISIPLSNLEKFVPYLDDFDVIIGSKKKKGAITLREQRFVRKFIGHAHSRIANLILGMSLYDYQCGFKLFSKDVVSSIFSKLCLDRWGMDPEIAYVANKYGYHIIEVPIVWIPNTSSTVKILRDSIRGFSDLLLIRLYDLVGKYN